MRLLIAAIGRLPRGPERALCEKLSGRTDALSRSTRLGPLELREAEARSGGGAAAETRLLSEAVEDCERLIALDERGRNESSRAFAERLVGWRDAGVRRVGFVIGGADGLEPSLRERADLVLGLGAMTWPHALARAMLLEQIYRAATIAAGHPYHREG